TQTSESGQRSRYGIGQLPCMPHGSAASGPPHTIEPERADPLPGIAARRRLLPAEPNAERVPGIEPDAGGNSLRPSRAGEVEEGAVDRHVLPSGVGFVDQENHPLAYSSTGGQTHTRLRSP